MSQPWYLRRALVWGILIAFFAQCILPFHPVSPANAQTAGAVNPGPAETRKAVKQRMARFFQAVEILHQSQDQSEYSVAALARKLGKDPNRLFAFVRDKVAYHPYYGSLRGPLGTLLGRAGNSLDQSLLLTALLQNARQKVRIVKGNLEPAIARKLVEQLRDRPPQLPPSEVDDKAKELLAKALGLTKEEFQKRTEDALAQGELADEALWDRLQKHHTIVSEQLSKAGVNIPGAPVPLDQLQAEAAEHFWVQRQLSNGTWQDLDPSLRGARAGRALTLSLDAYAPDKLPETLYHKLRISLILRIGTREEVDARQIEIQDERLIDATLRVSELTGTYLSLANAPDLGSIGSLLGRGLTSRQVIRQVNEFTPVLTVGDKPRAIGKTFDLDGRLYNADRFSDAGKAERQQKAIGESFQGIGGALGGLLNEIDDKNKPKRSRMPSKTRIHGQWVEYQLISPRGQGQASLQHNFRRDILAPERVINWSSDVGAKSTPSKYGKDELRAALSWKVEFAPITGRVSPAFASNQQISAIRDNKRFIDMFVDGTVGKPPTPKIEAVSQPVPYPGNATNFIVASQHWDGLLARSRFPGIRYYYDRPGLIAYESQFQKRSDDRFFVKEGFDIVANDVRTVEISVAGVGNTQNASSSLAFSMQRGVLETVIERVLMERRFDARAPYRVEISNLSTVVDTASKQDIELEVIQRTPEGMKKLNSLRITAAAKQEIASDLNAGSLVIVPKRAIQLKSGSIQVGWWRVNSETGHVLGIMAGKRGQSFGQRALLGGALFSIGGAACLMTDMIQGTPANWKFVVACGIGAVFAGLALIATTLGAQFLLGIAAASTVFIGGVFTSPLLMGGATNNSSQPSQPIRSGSTDTGSKETGNFDLRDAASTSEDTLGSGGGSPSASGNRKPVELQEADLPAPLNSDDVRDLQVKLTLQGYYSGPRDGVERPDLLSAIADFQRSIGATPTGVLTKGQADRLLRPK